MNNIKKLIFKTETENLLNFFTYNMATGQVSAPLACQEITYPIILYANTDNPVVGTIFYTDTSLTIPYDGDSLWFKRDTDLTSYNISDLGELIQTSIECSLTGYAYLIEQCETGEMWALEKIFTFSTGDSVTFRKGIPPSGNIYCGVITNDNVLSIYTATPYDNVIRICGDTIHCDIAP